MMIFIKSILWNFAVRSDQLQWLPNGSEFEVPSADKGKKTYTSFSCSQDTILPLKKNPIIPRYPDIILAKLRPGQVSRSCLNCSYHLLKLQPIDLNAVNLDLDRIQIFLEPFMLVDFI